MEEVQDLVESLAQELHRSVAIDDADLRLIAVSSHFDDVDRMRLQSLTGRRVEGAARDYTLGSGVRNWHSPHSIPPKPEIGAQWGRLGIPLWSRYELLGFMWIIEREPLSADEVSMAQVAADRIRDIIVHRSEAAAKDIRDMESRTVSLLSPDAEERQSAAQDLADSGLLRAAPRYTAVVVAAPGQRKDSIEAQSVSLRRVFRSIGQSRTQGMTIWTVGDLGFVLVLGHASSGAVQELRELGTRLLRELTRLDPPLGESARIGIGSAQRRLEDIAVSFDQARHAARHAHRTKDRVETWGQAPLDSLLDALLAPQTNESLLPEVVRALNALDTETLTLIEVFLDLGGRVVNTAEKLHLHKTTVYYRLSKLKESLGMDFEDGETRLMIHLWLKVRKRLPRK